MFVFLRMLLLKHDLPGFTINYQFVTKTLKKSHVLQPKVLLKQPFIPSFSCTENDIGYCEDVFLIILRFKVIHHYYTFNIL